MGLRPNQELTAECRRASLGSLCLPLCSGLGGSQSGARGPRGSPRLPQGSMRLKLCLQLRETTVLLDCVREVAGALVRTKAVAPNG